MDADHPSLYAAFDQLGVAQAVRAQVIERHGEPHRHYHTLRHIDLMLGLLPQDHAFAHEMIAATLFHDIVYDPTAGDNEERSLSAFLAVADRIAPAAALDTPLVSAMILATKSHHFRDEAAPRDQAINRLLKADLGILWHPDRQVYAWYAAGVRQEYAFVPDVPFREARTRILSGLRDDLLDSEQLTIDEAQRLAANVDWELGSLP